ncbi:sulfate adenylyltransferase subunit CysD [Blochmannia endosymbiont of Polyrhachis (Hedomyrma) turneri]|uniref:sulfate adenylyltransferase subunit CysD n=1 Tax=Blochmannia endosymbiont of Polyrhachis (Hedomyrma) turneri TaxID=1505596 RepID=UPI00061A53FE|nr:sulfate adenylyltransferase subunit CysD [Blochmannia endosymbiont of Polyrhachis (Hedomyrma) turneri]AKC59746.1 Sulfate adenylyltransferase subunit 2 [Blochmannia endosymbiont of Polyrhachis (Hedomyrma) turneri]
MKYCEKRSNYLYRLESESIYIFREVVSEFHNPVMMYSVGKDSSVMLHLARKAFYPKPVPFSILHIDTGWKFTEMYHFRDYIAQTYGLNLLIYKNSEEKAVHTNPFLHDVSEYTNIMKTEALKQALNKYKFDAAVGGGRRDEEQSRAKERIYSFRDIQHRWNPKDQRPEMWNNYNSQIKKGESIRVFPLSNWTELDVWQYIFLENIEFVSLYLAKKRPVVRRNDMLILVNDNRFNLQSHEVIEERMVRFRTLGCWPLTGAIESESATLLEVIQEMFTTTTSERCGRIIDFDQSGSMEIKKRQGYF